MCGASCPLSSDLMYLNLLFLLKEKDLAVAALTIDKVRLTAVDFTYPFWFEPTAAIINVCQFFNPWSGMIWWICTVPKSSCRHHTTFQYQYQVFINLDTQTGIFDRSHNRPTQVLFQV